jgi:hypothetical protein
MDMNKISLFAILLCLSTLTWAQEAVVSSGNYHKNTSGSISWGLGESVIQTFVAGENIITQGFQQTRLTITSVEEIPGLDFTIIAYPNPAHDFVNLKIEKDDFTDFRYELFDQNGRILKQGFFESNPIIIPFNDRSAGIYFIRVISSNKELKTFKILKQ